MQQLERRISNQILGVERVIKLKSLCSLPTRTSTEGIFADDGDRSLLLPLSVRNLFKGPTEF